MLKEIEPKILCPVCNMDNRFTQDTCTTCGFVFDEEGKKLLCTKCKQPRRIKKDAKMNDIKNTLETVCSNCGHKF